MRSRSFSVRGECFSSCYICLNFRNLFKSSLLLGKMSDLEFKVYGISNSKLKSLNFFVWLGYLPCKIRMADISLFAGDSMQPSYTQKRTVERILWLLVTRCGHGLSYLEKGVGICGGVWVQCTWHFKLYRDLCRSSSNILTVMIILRGLGSHELYHLNPHDNAKNLSWPFWKKSVPVSKITPFSSWEQETYV